MTTSTNSRLTGLTDPSVVDSLAKETRLGFQNLTKAKTKELATAPTITSGAATSMVANSRQYSLGYQSPLSAVSIAGFNQVEGATDQALKGDNVTLDFAMSTFEGTTKRVSFVHTGRYVEIEFQGSTTSVIYVLIDGKFESLTPISESTAFRKYDFGSSDTRRIDIVAGGSATNQYKLKNIWVEPTDSIEKAPIRGPRTILMTDSFGANAGTFTTPFSFATGWDDVWGSGVSSSGYIATSGDTVPTFAMRVQHDVIDFNPQVVGIVGSVNDDGHTYDDIYAAALSLYNTLTSSLPNALIFAAHTVSGGADTETFGSLSNRAAKKAAAQAAGILWVDPTEQQAELTLLETTLTLNEGAGSVSVRLDEAWTNFIGVGLVGSTLSLGDDASGTGERRYIKTTAIGGGVTDCFFEKGLINGYTAGDPVTIVGSSYTVGTGKVGTTTGYGNADLLVSSDGVHPEAPAGHDALSNSLANSLITAIKNS